jgi:hypothetical protein
MTKSQKSFKFPRLWWGWLGKQSNLNETEYRKRQQARFKTNRFKGLTKLLKQLKNWILGKA